MKQQLFFSLESARGSVVTDLECNSTAQKPDHRATPHKRRINKQYCKCMEMKRKEREMSWERVIRRGLASSDVT